MLSWKAKPQTARRDSANDVGTMKNDSDSDSDELVFEFETEIAIPPLLYSEESRRPFERCIDCNAELLLPIGVDNDEPVFYQVQKVIVRNEAVFELAMCVDCQERLRRDFSEETSQAIIAYCQERFSGNPFTRRGSFEDCIAACHACGKPRSECHRYSIGGILAGASLLLTPGPHILCDDCEIEISELISQKTRDAWDRFVDEHFDSPPGLEVDEWDRMPVLM